MQYSLEESALIGGLIAEYFSRASVSESLRAAYRQVYQHLIDGHLTHSGCIGLPASGPSTGARGTENLPCSNFENKSHAEKQGIEKKQTSRACLLLVRYVLRF